MLCHPAQYERTGFDRDSVILRSDFERLSFKFDGKRLTVKVELN